MSEYDFTKIVREIAAKENIENCKLQFQYSTNKGDGYLGTIKAVQLVGKNKTLDIVFKYSHRDPKAHDKVPLRDVYLTEIIFYRVIVPAFDHFQAEYNLENPFNNSCKFYGCVTTPLNELLALQNLKSFNYDLWDRKRLMNNEHLECALQTFAKFHGTSFAMKTLNPKLFKNLGDNLEGILAKFIKAMGLCQQLGRAIKDILRIFDPNTEKHYFDKLNAFADNVEKEMFAAFNYHDNDVITQGDCWCNNAMYQYSDMNNRQSPKGMKMLDFQMVSLGSPALDISYFFYTIAPKESLDNLDYYLKFYHDAIADHLQKFDLDIKDVFSYERLIEHWKTASKFGFGMTFVLRRAMLTESDDAPDLANDAENFITNLKIDEDVEKLYHKQIKEIVVHYIDRKFI